MPLDQFKTQVLLLHSEQSTLDSLSSGFNDRYTVHCATSGSEALTTLGETPINIIVSAQDLPGMSGVEALREAKKRSPETIGILLAGKHDAGLEALVGEKVVFQVVRGDVTGDKLLKLVDNATQQMRLMALAESANDTAANPDEPSGEHIVMETSENGSSIISDGTGRFPALNPKKVAAATAAGTRAVDVLVLTKDQEFLQTIKESSRGVHKVHYANTLKQADEFIRQHKVGVAVVDAAMVGDKVEQLTQHLRKGAPRLVSIVAGRRDDGEMLMDLINRGKVYRFLLKPVSPGRARLAVEASVKHHLEAPDAAFKIKDSAAPARPAPKPAPKPVARPAPPPAPAAKARPAPAPAPGPVPKTAAQAAKAAPRPTPAPAPSDPPLGNPKAGSPVNEGLASAFGDDDAGFTETVTGLISAVGKKFKGDEKPASNPATTRDTLAGLESPASAGGAGGALAGKSKVIGIAAAAVVAVAAGLFWFMGGKEEQLTAPVAEPVAASTPSITEADVVFDDTAAAPAVDIDAELAAAETALLEARLEDAAAALSAVAAIDPENSRLAFLTAQLQQAQLRGHLADARAAIRDTRFEDAGNAIATARALGVADASEINAIADELAAARSDQRVDETLALATARLEEGSLIRPSNDNARYYYELVLANDPANTAARQGLNVVASKLVLQARAQIDAGNLGAATTLLTDARAIDATNADLATTDAALIAARDAVAARERRQAEAQRQAEADRRAAAQRAAEQRAAQEQAAQEQAAQEQAEADRQAAAEAAAKQQPDTAAVAATSPAKSASDEPSIPVADSGPAAMDATQAEPSAESDAQSLDIRYDTPISISALERTRYVAPRYPRAAQRRGLNGWVDVVFTVTVDGTVKDVGVRQSSPEDVFDSAALRAVEKWEFEPVIENGVAVEKRAGVRMMFALE